MLCFVVRNTRLIPEAAIFARAYEALPAIYDVSLNDNTWLPTLDTIVAATDAKAAAIFGTNETDFEYSVERVRWGGCRPPQTASQCASVVL